MATPTGITIHAAARQFRGVVDDIWSVSFTIDSPSIAPNASEQSIIPVPGLRLATDIVLGFTHTPGFDGGIVEEVHVGADNELHVVRHNASGGAIDMAAMTFKVVVARTI